MPLLTFSVQGVGTGVRQDIDVLGSGHLVRSDAYPDFGGEDAHPSPLAYLLASLSSCLQVVSSVVAKELGVEVSAYDIAVDGDFDPTVLVSGAQADDRHSDTFSAVRVAVTLTTDASPDQVGELAAAVERRCPVSALFQRAGTQVTTTWTTAPALAA